MADLARFRSLAKREQAIVAIGVLLDGHDAADYLGSDRERKAALSRAAKDLTDFPLDLRLPLVGTLLRSVLSELEQA